MIRNLARRERPLTTVQIGQRYPSLASAARRHFGSWTKAALAAGVDPSKLQKVARWSPERVIETILTRALRNETLVARLIEPQSLVAAGQRFFGGWAAAVTAAGLDPTSTVLLPMRNKPSDARRAPAPHAESSRMRRKLWNKERVIAAILARMHAQKPINATALLREAYSLYRAMRRYCGNWSEAMRAAGLDSAVYRLRPPSVFPSSKAGPRDAVARQSQADQTLRPDSSA